MKRKTKFNIVKATSVGVALLLPVSGYSENVSNHAGSSTTASMSHAAKTENMGGTVSQTAASKNAIAVDPSMIIEQIRQITMDNRDAIVENVEALVNVTSKKVDEVQEYSAKLDKSARVGLILSMSKVEAQAQALLKRNEEVREASESEIMEASGRLAARLEGFAKATVELEAAVRSAGMDLSQKVSE